MQWTFNPAGENLSRSISELAAGQFDEAMFRLSSQFGYFGVHLFVLMSGLGLAWGTPQNCTFRRFLRRRFSKLVPPFWTAVVFFAVWRILIEQPYSMREVLERVTLLSTFDQANFFRVDPPLWCLAVFFQLYLLFLPLRYIVQRFGPRVMVPLVATAFAVRWICMTPAVLRWNENFGHAFGLNWLAVFASGIWIGSQLRERGRVAIPGSVMVFAVSTGAGLLFLSERWRAMYPIHDSAIAATIGVAALIAWKALPHKFLAAPIVAVGSVSFPLYLYHRPIVGAFILLWQKNPVPAIDAMSLSLLSISSLTVILLLIQRWAKPEVAVFALGVQARPRGIFEQERSTALGRSAAAAKTSA